VVWKRPGPAEFLSLYDGEGLKNYVRQAGEEGATVWRRSEEPLSPDVKPGAEELSAAKFKAAIEASRF
jgi:hypothetical protein